jgi:hypothetical protein
MADQTTRYQINQKVRQVLVKHAVDLIELQYSCSGKAAFTVYLYGNLKKDPTGEFSPSHIEALANELLNLPNINHIQFALDNWHIASDFGGLKILKK